jgi:hypothetical protein
VGLGNWQSGRIIGALCVAFVLAFATARCGSGPAQSPPQAKDDDREAADDIKSVYPAAFGEPDPRAVRLCDALHGLPERRKAECCGSKSAPGGLTTECVRVVTIALRDKAVTVADAALDRCTADAEQLVRGCDWVTPLAPRAPDSCQAILTGLYSAGAQCRSSLDCEDGLFCRGATPTTTGVCSAPAPAGAACGAPADTLATYVKDTDYVERHRECEGFCRSGRCADFVGAGGSCSSNVQCGPGAQCLDRTCAARPLPKAGEPCKGSCADDAACVAGTCIARKAAGEACSSPFECQAACIMKPGEKAGVCGGQCTAFPFPTLPVK